MQEIDKLIKDALTEEDADLYEALDRDSLPERVIDSFRGKSRWLVVGITGGMLGLFVGSGAFAVMLLRTDDLVSSIRYATGFVFCFFGVGLLKTWYWMELNKYAMLRETKRLELQIARLDERLREQKSPAEETR
jgi:hypothetical protein